MIDPHPDQLGTTFDWMSVPHAGLYRMVNEKLNPEVGQAAAVDWSRLGEELSEIGDELADLARDTDGAWAGVAANLAVTRITALARWARNTADTAAEVSGCLAMASDNAARAREAMPPPVGTGSASSPTAPPADAGMAPTFVGDFASAPNLLLDVQSDLVQRDHGRHAEAARVMDQFQVASREVYRTVPRFSAPETSAERRGHGEVVDLSAPGTAPAGTAAAAVASGAAAPGFDGSATGGGDARGGAATGAPGLRVGVSDPRPAAPLSNPVPGGDGSVSGKAPATPLGMGAMPMGAAGAAGDADRERAGLGFLEGAGMWDLSEGELMVSAAVIGELPHHE